MKGYAKHKVRKLERITFAKTMMMKNPVIVFVLILFSVSAMSQELKKNQKAVIKTALSCDHCKACETCGKNFQSNMLKIKGVKMYDLDEKNMTITVYYNAAKTDLEAIKRAISKLGYDADDMKADALAYEKLDGCCKKI